MGPLYSAIVIGACVAVAFAVILVAALRFARERKPLILAAVATFGGVVGTATVATCAIFAGVTELTTSVGVLAYLCALAVGFGAGASSGAWLVSRGIRSNGAESLR
jgi:hypothetical protein